MRAQTTVIASFPTQHPRTDIAASSDVSHEASSFLYKCKVQTCIGIRLLVQAQVGRDEGPGDRPFT